MFPLIQTRHSFFPDTARFVLPFTGSPPYSHYVLPRLLARSGHENHPRPDLDNRGFIISLTAILEHLLFWLLMITPILACKLPFVLLISILLRSQPLVLPHLLGACSARL